jgi:hypothetical protein
MMEILKKCDFFLAHSQLTSLPEHVNFIAHAKPNNVEMGFENKNCNPGRY